MTFEEYMESVFSVDMESRQYRYEDMHEAWQEAQEEAIKEYEDGLSKLLVDDKYRYNEDAKGLIRELFVWMNMRKNK